MAMHTRSKNIGQASGKTQAAHSLLEKRSASALVQDEAQDASDNLYKSLQDKDEENKHDKSESLSKHSAFELPNGEDPNLSHSDDDCENGETERRQKER